MKAYQHHTPSGFCYRVKYAYGDNKDAEVYCIEDVAKKFVECMEQEVREIAEIYND